MTMIMPAPSRTEIDRFSMRIDHAPLPSPVFAHSLVTMDPSAFHPIRPIHVRMHDGKHRIHGPRIKVRIGDHQQISVDLSNALLSLIPPISKRLGRSTFSIDRSAL